MAGSNLSEQNIGDLRAVIDAGSTIQERPALPVSAPRGSIPAKIGSSGGGSGSGSQNAATSGARDSTGSGAQSTPGAGGAIVGGEFLKEDRTFISTDGIFTFHLTVATALRLENADQTVLTIPL